MKGQLLPKWMRTKGKSKFMYPRLKEEGIKFGDKLWMGEITESPLDKLYIKLNK